MPKPHHYLPKKWAEAKKRMLSRAVSMTDAERTCVECEVRSLELWLRRYRALQVRR